MARGKQMIKELLNLKHCKATQKINFLLIPVSNFDINRKGAIGFNKIYLWLKKQDLYKLERTASGGIKNGSHMLVPAWDVRANKYCVEITVILRGFAWRIQFRTKTPKQLSGRTAFTKFKKLLLKDGVDLEQYVISNGPEVKKEIETYLVKANHQFYLDKIFSHAHHIDFHSSFAGGLANTHPEFRPTLMKIFKDREKDEMNKHILNFSVGFMQSMQGCNARWAHLSKDAIGDNNKRVTELAKKVEEAGRKVLLFNTDGFWYDGEIYHGEGEGLGLGEWHNDHINCKFRMSSAGVYEFIENGEYTPVVRGIPNDSKSEWKWGDIYTKKAVPDIFTFTEEEGVKLNGEKI